MIFLKHWFLLVSFVNLFLLFFVSDWEGMGKFNLTVAAFSFLLYGASCFAPKRGT